MEEEEEEEEKGEGGGEEGEEEEEEEEEGGGEKEEEEEEEEEEKVGEEGEEEEEAGLTCVVPGNVAEGPGSCLLHSWVKLLQADSQSVQRSTVHHRLGQLRRVPGHCPQDKGSSFLVEPLEGGKEGGRGGGR